MFLLYQICLFATNSALVFKIQRANDSYSWGASHSMWEVSRRCRFCCRSQYAQYDHGSAQVMLCEYLGGFFCLQGPAVWRSWLLWAHLWSWVLLALPSLPFGITVKRWPDWAAKPLGFYRTSSWGPMAALPSWDGVSKTSSPQQLCSCPRRWWSLCWRTLLDRRFGATWGSGF